MPVTLAHPAAVLPLRGLGLPLSAMVVGSMTPDLPVLAQARETYGYTHSLLGMVTVDLLLALVLLAIWDRWARDALVDSAPALLRDRLPARARLGRRAWLLAPPAAVVGAATHLGWDAFTHADRWGVRHVPWLQQTYGPLRGDQWAQYLSGAFGLAVVGLVLLALLTRPSLPTGRPRRLPAATLPASLVAAGALSVGVFLAGFDFSIQQAAFDAAIVGILALVAVVGGVTRAWALAPEVGEPVG